MKGQMRWALLCAGVVLCSHVADAQTWTRKTTSNDPSARRNASAIYDPVGHRMIVFGGFGSSGSLNDVWSLNLTTLDWTQIVPAAGPSPAPRSSHNAMYDAASHRMLIWSGQGAGLFNDVWAFNLNTNAWTELWQNGNMSGAPLIRYGTAAVFDPLTRRLINFAGFTSSGRFEDTWAFQTDSLRWTDRTNNPHPPRRCLHNACSVDDRRLMIVYGGQQTGALDDLWALNLDTFSWREFAPVLRPPARYFTSCVYDGSANIVIFGGQTSTGVANDLWRFSLADSSWHQMQQGTTIPAARYGHTAVYVPSRGSMVLFGGQGAALFNDTWEFTLPVTDVKTVNSLPEQITLEQNYPNPFNPTTTIAFTIPPNGGRTSLKLFDVLGREVVTLLEEELKPGRHQVKLEAGNLSSGVYFYRLSNGGFALTRKMVLAR